MASSGAQEHLTMHEVQAVPITSHNFALFGQVKAPLIVLVNKSCLVGEHWHHLCNQGAVRLGTQHTNLWGVCRSLLNQLTI